MYCVIYFIVILSAQAAPENGLENNAAYREERKNIVQEEARMALGGNIILSNKEELANRIFLHHKQRELDQVTIRSNYSVFQHYQSYHNKINDSIVYQIIKRMPKGAALHVHDSALMGPDYLVSLTYLDDLFICIESERIQFLFSNYIPSNNCNSTWKLVKEVRHEYNDPKEFDHMIRKHFTIHLENPQCVNTDANDIWNRFEKVFYTISPLLRYRPAWQKYLYDAMKAFRNDNIMYMELRSSCPRLYELNGTRLDVLESAMVYKNIQDEFILDNPDFLGIKIIISRRRLVDLKDLEGYLEDACKLKEVLGPFVAGFDLIGQEDLGRPLNDFLPLLMKMKGKLDYFFHAGETNLWGTGADENLIDAIKLGSRRIGHAFTLTKHPVLMRMVRELRIGLEVNVISNQILRLVHDVRNHPLAQFLAQDLPIVLSSDDPGMWDAEPLSHDYYVALVGVASRNSGLRTLKQLALNSLQYSALSQSSKELAISLFEERWTTFIEQIIVEYSQF